MFIARKHIPRRAFLKGAGVTLALPLLDAMVPAGVALAQTPATPKSRFMGIFFPHRFRSLGRRGISDRDQTEENGRRRCHRWQRDRRSNHRAKDRAGDAAAVAAALGRGSECQLE